MKRKLKSLTQAQENFQKRALDFLSDNGAMKVEGAYYDWVLPTPIGDLEITVYDDWIAQRFRNDFAGQAYLESRFTSKWNFHYTCDAETLGNANCHVDWQAAIGELLAFKPGPEFWTKARALQRENAEYWATQRNLIEASVQQRQVATAS